MRLAALAFRRRSRETKDRQYTGSLNEAATAAYRDAHDAQLARAPATHHPAGPADGDNLVARFRGDLHDPWAPDTWIDPPATS